MARYSHSETRKEEHLRLLQRIQDLPFAESCCEICHCDCYSSHRSSERLDSLEAQLKMTGDNNNKTSVATSSDQIKSKINSKRATKAKRKKSAASEDTPQPAREAAPRRQTTKSAHLTTAGCIKRSKSANSVRSQQSAASIYNMRDCFILRELLSSLENCGESRQQVVGRSENEAHSFSTEDPSSHTKSLCCEQNEVPLKLCDSMANLCLSPKVRQAFHSVSTHDQRILNRMATKRSECVAAEENAWLARKYWENERYERELLKCEEMDEYKKAVLDKQFQDYLRTKARLNAIAQRDLAELQSLRSALQQKDERTQRRLEAVRTGRGITQCQRRCDELCKSETVNVHQEERELDEALRKRAICQRLSERLERADHLRAQILESYLKRVRYDNHLEQLMHEEKWRERQRCELQKREQLKEHISRKRSKSQRFVESRQRRNEALTRTAKMSASLRELVRSSVTPDAEADARGGFRGVVPPSLSRLLLDRRPISKLATQ